MEETQWWQFLVGGGIGSVILAGLIRLAQSVWLKSEAQRADLSGNLSSIGNMTQANAVLLATINQLNTQLESVTKDRDLYRTRYFECIGQSHEP